MKNIIKKIGAAILIIIMNTAVLFATFDTYSYPQGFIDDENNFNAQIVIGANSTNDIIVANRLIDVLTTDDIGDINKNLQPEKRVRITYKEKGSTNGIAGDSIDPLRRNADLNYGETIEEESDNNGIDDDDTDFLQDESFTNGINNEDYTQRLILLNGEFNFALRDDVDNVEDITDGIYYDNDEEFARYVIDFDSLIDLDDTNDLDEDMIGSVLTIMGNEFTIIGIDNDDSDLDSLELIGGSEKIIIEEGETIEVEIDGKEYEITVNIVTEDKVSLIVNGDSGSMDIYDVKDFSGISIAAVELIDSSRESINGFAEIVVGGKKILLEDDNRIVQINEEDIDDIYDDYEVVSDFSDGNNGMKTITITYKIREETLLQKGDYLEDILFDSFIIRYEGERSVDYNKLTIDVSSDDTIKIVGELFNGKSFNRDFLYTTSTDGTDGDTYIKGDSDNDRVFSSNSDLDLFMPQGFTKINDNVFEIDFTESLIRGSGIFQSEDTDTQYWYEITSVDSSDGEIDFEEILDETRRDEVSPSDFIDNVEVDIPSAVADNDAGTLQIDKRELGDAILAFNHDYILDFQNAESEGVSGYFTLYYDNDIDADDAIDEEERYNITIDWDAGDDRFNLILDESDSDFVNTNYADISEDDDDTQVYVTRYGTQIKYNSDDKDNIVISIPDEQVEGEVRIIFGDSSVTSTESLIVDGDELEEKIDELEDDGYEIIKTEILDEDDKNNLHEIRNLPKIILDDEITSLDNLIIIGGPAINEAAARILGIDFPAFGIESGLQPNEALIRYYDEYNSLLIFGYELDDTTQAVSRVLKGESLGQEVYLTN